jgi:hypothetical protein
MNRATVRRWLNEYLDGEIGLADKAELERLMDQDPTIRQEYKELRQIGLLLGSMPEVNVHPYRFRAKMREALDANSRPYFTPQRSFTAAMLVFMLVITLSFSLVVYQQRMLGNSEVSLGTQPTEAAYVTGTNYDFVLNTGVRSDEFFNRVLLESSLGRDKYELLGVFLVQSQAFEGATCRGSNGMKPARFVSPIGRTMIVNVAPEQAQAMARLAEELNGQPSKCLVMLDGCKINELKGYLASNPDTTVIPLRINFSAPRR